MCICICCFIIIFIIFIDILFDFRLVLRACAKQASNVLSAPGARAQVGTADGRNALVRSFIPNSGRDTFARSTPGSRTFDKYTSIALAGMNRALVAQSAYERHQQFIANYVTFYGFLLLLNCVVVGVVDWLCQIARN